MKCLFLIVVLVVEVVLLVEAKEQKKVGKIEGTPNDSVGIRVADLKDMVLF